MLARHASPLEASLLWFREMKAIDGADIGIVHHLRQHRNGIAHHLPEFIAGAREIDLTLLAGLCDLVAKIDRWWIREIEVPTNPDFDAVDVECVPESEIASGRMMFLSMLFQIATGDEEEAVMAYESFMRPFVTGHGLG